MCNSQRAELLLFAGQAWGSLADCPIRWLFMSSSSCWIQIFWDDAEYLLKDMRLHCSTKRPNPVNRTCIRFIMVNLNVFHSQNTNVYKCLRLILVHCIYRDMIWFLQPQTCPWFLSMGRVTSTTNSKVWEQATLTRGVVHTQLSFRRVTQTTLCKQTGDW